MEVLKIRPEATEEYTYGNDGWDGHYYIKYSCPKCHKNLYEGEIACVNCGTFFDWSHKAVIKTKRYIEWD